MTLPMADESATVTVPNKAYVSLRTKSARGARNSFKIALNRLPQRRGELGAS
ncbi:hypothetical protein [Bosea vaviloviae]|uniref:hypothetical protein n=1 Tax=Bosea vaviloviae TaxID=1526658 RepID=UPI0012E1034B|nr:hypothetical protein [Bosea vaviloviae]